MNQFKKAKQKLIEQGKEVENITDLKTAGVSEPDQPEQIEESPKKEIATLKEDNIKNELPNVKKVEKKVDEKPIEIIQKEEVKTPENTVVQPENFNEIPPEKPLEVPETHSLQEETTESNSSASFIAPIEIETEIAKPKQEAPITLEKEQINTVTKEVVTELNTPTYTEPTIQYVETVPVPKQVVYEPIQQQPVQQIQSEIRQPVYINQASDYPQQFSRITQQYQEPIQQPYINTQYTTQQTTHTAKKSIPNIFSPKEEAKSMRKSLVLKPTSVKKAENYCNKNGGSFNELIQTLLDNFIDEYGL